MKRGIKLHENSFRPARFVVSAIAPALAVLIALTFPVDGLPVSRLVGQETGEKQPPDDSGNPDDQDQEKPAPPDDPKQEESPPANETGEVPNAEEDLQGLLDEWSAMESSLTELEERVRGETDTESARQIRTEYVEQNNQAIELVERIEKAAVEKLMNGTPDQALSETLTGLVINHAAFERDSKALELGQSMIDAGVGPEYFDAAAKADRLTPAAKEVLRELAIRAREAVADDLPRVKLVTSKGEVVVELFENEAPDTVGNFVNLVETGFYDGLTFHRVIDGFMAQTGDPKGDGTGGPGYTIYCECYESDFRRHFPYVLSMAHTGTRNTGGSQFYITFSRTSHLDGRHTVFGRVIEGQSIVDSLQRVNPEESDQPQPDQIISAEVLRKRDHPYEPARTSE